MFPRAGSPQPGARLGERWERGRGGHRSRVCFFVLPTSFMSCDRFTCTHTHSHSLTHSRTHTGASVRQAGAQGEQTPLPPPRRSAKIEKSLQTRGGGLVPNGWDLYTVSPTEGGRGPTQRGYLYTVSPTVGGRGPTQSGYLYTVSPTVGGRGPTQSVPFWSMWMAAFSPHTRTYSGRDLRRRAPSTLTTAPPPPPPSRTDWTRLVPPPVQTGHVSSTLTTAPRSAGRWAVMSVSEGRPEYLRGRAAEANHHPPPPSYKVDTPRPAPRTKRTRRVTNAGGSKREDGGR